MKKVILLVIAISFLTINFYTQAKSISDKEYYAKYNAAIDVSKNLKRRIETKEIDFENGIPTKTVEMILEIINKKNQRFTKIEKEDSTVNKTEFVMFNSKVYKRENDGKWVKGEWESGGHNRVSMGKSENTIETIKVDNRNVILLSSLTKYYWNNQPRFTLDKVWIDEKNRLLKVEFSSGLSEPKKVSYTETSTYFYDSKIVINNPLLKPKGKK